MGVFWGIDPGLHGAIALLNIDPATRQKTLLTCFDIPTDEIEIGGQMRHRLSDGRLIQRLNEYREYTLNQPCWLEWPEARPLRTVDKQTGRSITRQPGAAGMLTLGAVCGALRMACVAFGMQMHEVRPGGWKRQLNLGAGKDESRRLASELFPSSANIFSRKKDDGRAEAVLIAYYGSLQK